MKKVFVNFTNHPSSQWADVQKKEAMKYGEIVDIEFPKVNPAGTKDYILKLAEESVRRILQLRPAAVLCQGEFCLAYHVVTGLKKEGVRVVAACSERIVKQNENIKEVTFVFQQFREY